MMMKIVWLSAMIVLGMVRMESKREVKLTLVDKDSKSTPQEQLRQHDMRVNQAISLNKKNLLFSLH